MHTKQPFSFHRLLVASPRVFFLFWPTHGRSRVCSGTTSSPYYHGGCTAVPCPEGSTGTNVPAGDCTCAAGYGTSGGNIALNQPVTQSSEVEGGAASRGVDGNRDGNWGANTCTHTGGGDPEWWQVDLGKTYSVTDISLYHRTDCCHDRLTGAHIWLSATNDYTDTGARTECSSVTDGGDVAQPEVGTCSGATGQFITVQHSGQSFTICEFEATSGTVAATSSAPFFSGSCVATECPADSSGTDVGSGCTCDTGFGGTITAFP